jgi:hypothetical protein
VNALVYRGKVLRCTEELSLFVLGLSWGSLSSLGSGISAAGQIVGVALRAGKVHVVAASRGQWPRPFVENADGAMDPWRPVQPSRECVWNLGLYGCSASVVLLLRCRVILLDVSWYRG